MGRVTEPGLRAWLGEREAWGVREPVVDFSKVRSELPAYLADQPQSIQDRSA